MPFSLFAKKETPTATRFNSCPEFKNLSAIIDQLYIEESTLKAAADKNGGTSLDYKKHALISRLMTLTKMEINSFNQKSPPSDEIDNTIDKCIIANKIMINMMLVLSQDLNKDRLLDNIILLNSHRTYAKRIFFNTSHYGLIGTALIASGPVGVVGALGVGLGTHIALRISEAVMGIDGATRSLQLLTQFMTELHKLTENLSYTLDITAHEKLGSIHNEIITEYKKNHPNANFDDFSKELVGITDFSRPIIGKK